MNFLERLEDSDWFRWLKFRINRRLVQFILEALSQLGVQRRYILAELACGSGYGAHLLGMQSVVALSIAVDKNKSLYKQAKVAGYRAQFIVGDLFDLPFESNTFDLVWNSSALEHFDDRLDALRAMVQVVRPGGAVFVGVPYRFGPMLLYYMVPVKAWRIWLGAPLSFRELERLMLQVGLVPQRRILYFGALFAGVFAVRQTIPSEN